MRRLVQKFDGSTLPSALRERYRMADGPALKVVLLILCSGNIDPDYISDTLSMSAELVERSLAFWEKAGLLTGEPASDTESQALPADAGQQTRAAQPRERAPLSPERVSELSLRNPEIATLLQETQHFLGRTLDTLESRTLLEIYEYDELPVEVILMIVAYCVPRMKNRRALITMTQRIADDWFAQGVVTASDAEAHLKQLEQREQREMQVAKILELEDPSFSKSQRVQIARWFEEYGYGPELIREAYLLKGNNSIAYIGKILQGWYNNGVKTVRDTRGSSSANAPVPIKKKKSSGSLLKQAVLSRAKED